MAVAQAQQPVVEMVLVGRGEPGAVGRPPDEGEGHVHDGDAQDEEGDEQGGEEEVGLSGVGGHPVDRAPGHRPRPR